MPSATPRSGGPIHVICEGAADVALINQLIKRDRLTGFSVDYTQGYQRFKDGVTALTVSSDWPRIKRLVIVGDNDQNPASRLRNARRALLNEGLKAPDTPGVVLAGSPSTAIYMMPREGEKGALESLLVEAVIQERPGLDQCLRRLDECAVTNCRDWDAAKRAKMQFQAAIAITCRVDPSAGAAHIWSKKPVPISIKNPVFDELAGFLRRVAQL